MREKENAELENYFAAISIKNKINNSTTSQKNQQQSTQSRRDLN